MELIDNIELYKTVTHLLRKHHNGYVGENDFNIQLNLVEKELLQVFIDLYEVKQVIVEHMVPFKKTLILASDQLGWIDYPSDHAYRITVDGLYLQNPVNLASTKRYSCKYLTDGQVSKRLSSSIAAPDMDKKVFYHTFRNGKIKVWPEDLFYVEYTYFRNPVYGSLKFTTSVVDGEDVDTITVEKPLEWRSITMKFFVVLLLNKFGVSLREDPAYYTTIQQLEDYYKQATKQ